MNEIQNNVVPAVDPLAVAMAEAHEIVVRDAIDAEGNPIEETFVSDDADEAVHVVTH